MATIKTSPPIAVSSTRYIKLGFGGGWSEGCIRDGIIRLGFETDIYWDLCLAGNWETLRSRYTDNHSSGTATSRRNQVRIFFEDKGEILWFTFHENLLWWSVIDPTRPLERLAGGEGTFRHTKFGWSSCNLKGEKLYESNLSGHLTMAKRFQGTSYAFKDKDYVTRRINGLLSLESENAKQITNSLEEAIQSMMTRLTEDDFELLVDLIFSASGWRRLGVTGGTQKLLDIEIVLPSTGSRAFVQVKSTADQGEFDEEYRNVFMGMKHYERMFYAFHSGTILCSDSNITLLDGPKLSRMVLDAGLVSWLIERVA